MSRLVMFAGLVLACVAAWECSGAQPPTAPGPAASSAPAAVATQPPARGSEYWSVQIKQLDPGAADIAALLSIVWDPAGGPEGKGGWTATLDVPPAPGLPGAVAVPFTQAEITETTILLAMPNGQGGTNAFQLTRGPGPDEA